MPRLEVAWFAPLIAISGSLLLATSPAIAQDAATAQVLFEAGRSLMAEEKFALATAKIRWRAVKGQRLPLLFDPAVLTQVTFPARSLKLVQAPADSRHARTLVAQESGMFDVEVHFK